MKTSICRAIARDGKRLWLLLECGHSDYADGARLDLVDAFRDGKVVHCWFCDSFAARFEPKEPDCDNPYHKGPHTPNGGCYRVKKEPGHG